MRGGIVVEDGDAIVIVDDLITSMACNYRPTMASVGSAGRGRFPSAAVDDVLGVSVKRGVDGGNDAAAMRTVRRG
jgi:hypothetical protein